MRYFCLKSPKRRSCELRREEREANSWSSWRVDRQERGISAGRTNNIIILIITEKTESLRYFSFSYTFMNSRVWVSAPLGEVSYPTLLQSVSHSGPELRHSLGFSFLPKTVQHAEQRSWGSTRPTLPSEHPPPTLHKEYYITSMAAPKGAANTPQY